jgi:hypothetical protein
LVSVRDPKKEVMRTYKFGQHATGLAAETDEIDASKVMAEPRERTFGRTGSQSTFSSEGNTLLVKEGNGMSWDEIVKKSPQQ